MIEKIEAFMNSSDNLIREKVNEIIDKVNELTDGCLPELSFTQDMEDYRKMARTPVSRSWGLDDINPKLAEEKRKAMAETKRKITEWLANAEENEIIEHLSKFNPKALKRLRDKINAVLERNDKDE